MSIVSLRHRSGLGRSYLSTTCAAKLCSWIILPPTTGTDSWCRCYVHIMSTIRTKCAFQRDLCLTGRTAVSRWRWRRRHLRMYIQSSSTIHTECSSRFHRFITTWTQQSTHCRWADRAHWSATLWAEFLASDIAAAGRTGYH